MKAVPGCSPTYCGEVGSGLLAMLASLSGVHGTVPPSELPPGFGADWSSQIAMPNQNAGCSWKLNVPPLPSCLGSFGGSVGRVMAYVLLLPDPGWLE